MTKPWVVVSYLGFVVLSILYLDRPIAVYFHALEHGKNLLILNCVTALGVAPAYMALFAVLILLFRYVCRNQLYEARVWFLFLCLSLSNVICLVLKITLGRARPELLFDKQLYGFYGIHKQSSYWSFPSGHTTTIMSIALGLCVVFPRYCYAFILMGLTVVASRVMLTQHYLSDVMMASYLVLLEVGILLYWLRRKSWLGVVLA